MKILKEILAQGVTDNILKQDPIAKKYGDMGGLISALLPYVYVAAGLSMFVMLIMGGVNLMLSGGDPGKVEKGYGMLKAALVGFFIVFLSYIIVQVVQTIFGISIL